MPLSCSRTKVTKERAPDWSGGPYAAFATGKPASMTFGLRWQNPRFELSRAPLNRLLQICSRCFALCGAMPAARTAAAAGADITGEQQAGQQELWRNYFISTAAPYCSYQTDGSYLRHLALCPRLQRRLFDVGGPHRRVQTHRASNLRQRVRAGECCKRVATAAQLQEVDGRSPCSKAKVGHIVSLPIVMQNG